MYLPAHFAEERLEVMHALMRAHPLGLLVCNGPDGPVANPVPFLLDAAASERGVLTAHLARANQQWKLLEDGATALVVFQGPQAYVTPSWYATKSESGKVVPTWNYCIVQARGTVRVHQDPQWLLAQVGLLTETHETGRAAAWSVSDAPERYIETQLRGIVGIEIMIGRIEGKWKVSQNRPETDRAGVANGMDSESREMSSLVRAYGLAGGG